MNSNRVVVVTGGAQGIGLGISRLFARNGHPVAILDLKEEELARVGDTLRAEGGRVLARFGGAEAALAPAAGGIARSLDMTLRRQGDDLHLDRPGDNLGRALTRLDRPQAVDLAGRYRSDELDATLDIDSFGGVYHAGFTGRLGQGAWKPLQPAGGECWIMPDPRAMDSAPPGAWTLRLRREGGRVAGVTAGCYIARGVDFRRIG
jgi:D-aminopeptidase